MKICYAILAGFWNLDIFGEEGYLWDSEAGTAEGNHAEVPLENDAPLHIDAHPEEETMGRGVVGSKGRLNGGGDSVAVIRTFLCKEIY